MKCPKCGSSTLAVEVRTWINYEDGKPDAFDCEDLEYCMPLPDADCICRNCQYIFPHTKAVP